METLNQWLPERVPELVAAVDGCRDAGFSEFNTQRGRR
jgi:hypothetical protein